MSVRMYLLKKNLSLVQTEKHNFPKFQAFRHRHTGLARLRHRCRDGARAVRALGALPRLWRPRASILLGRASLRQFDPNFEAYGPETKKAF